jgi:DNA-binding LytR/AlgR family response regulator
MSNVTCIIVEDEPLAAKVLTDYISEMPFLELKGIFKDAILASDYLRSNTVDLIFLDIHLPKLKGMAFLKTLSHPPAVIITTAYHQYAVEGFSLNVTDYLLKPIEFERFVVAVTRVKSRRADDLSPTGQTEKGTPGDTSETKDHLFLNVQKKKVKILFSEILYIESQREYVKIVTVKKEYLPKISTHEIETLLPPNHFRRVHRSFIIAVNKIESYTAEEVEINGVSIPVGREYRGVLEGL